MAFADRFFKVLEPYVSASNKTSRNRVVVVVYDISLPSLPTRSFSEKKVLTQRDLKERERCGLEILLR